jgi:glycosyltransferase involved in cell wall biosynthesis
MPEHDILFSLISASFNSGSKLGDTYASIANQGVEFEYLIMDGASTDGSRELAFKLAEDDKRVRVFSGPDTGIYDALNKSLARARGRYLCFLGAGDLLIPQSLAEISKYLPAELNSFVYGDVLKDGEKYCGEMRMVDLVDRNICQQSIFYGRDAFRICGDFNCKYRSESDWEFNMRCFGNRRVRKIYAPVVVSVFEAGGVSARIDETFRADKSNAVLKHMGLYTQLYVWIRPAYQRLRSALTRMLPGV